jgi:iron complex transport system substrate-binding protein
MRIVSLLASATEIVCALGAGDRLVGRSHECDNPEWVRGLAPCSEPAFDITVSSREIDAEVKRRIRAHEPLYIIHADRIRELAPDLVIAQEHCEVCAVTPGDVARANCDLGGARVLPLNASTVEGIFGSIRQVAAALDLEAKGCEVIAGERARLDAVRDRVTGQRRPTVVMLEWTDPIFAMANWGPELVDAAGGDLLLGRPGQHSTSMSGQPVADADPEVLIVAPCGFALDRALREQPVLEAYPWWGNLRAVRAGRVAFADGNLFFNRSGMTTVQTAEIIAEILHGLTFGAPAENRHWRWIS